MKKRIYRFKPILESVSTALSAALIVSALGGPLFMWQKPASPNRQLASRGIVAVIPGDNAPSEPAQPAIEIPSPASNPVPVFKPAPVVGLPIRRTAISAAPQMRAQAAAPSADEAHVAPEAAPQAAHLAVAPDELSGAQNADQFIAAMHKPRDSMTNAERALWIDQSVQFADRRGEIEPLLLNELHTKGSSEAVQRKQLAENELPAAQSAPADPGVGTSGNGSTSDRYLLQAHAHQALMAISDDADRAMNLTSDAMMDNSDSPMLVDLVYRQFVRKFPAKEADLKAKLNESGISGSTADQLVSGNL